MPYDLLTVLLYKDAKKELGKGARGVDIEFYARQKMTKEERQDYYERFQKQHPPSKAKKASRRRKADKVGPLRTRA